MIKTPETTELVAPEPVVQQNQVPSAGDLSPSADAALRRQAIQLSVGCVAAAVLCAVLWLSHASAADALALRHARAVGLRTDVRTILELRARPQHATEAGLPDSDLLERIDRAMQSAELDAKTLVSTLPQPPRCERGSDHAEFSDRLTFENLQLEQIVRFSHALLPKTRIFTYPPFTCAPAASAAHGTSMSASRIGSLRRGHILDGVRHRASERNASTATRDRAVS